MATLLDDAPQSGENDGPNVQTVEQPNENLTPEMEEKIEALRHRKDPVNILVIGPTGAGKSTLINAMFGKDVAKVGDGPTSVTPEVNSYETEYKSVKISIYDTPGFGDTGGKEDHSILLDIDKHGKFDLILICSQLGGRADRAMFLELASSLHKEMWKRTVVVLTQADRLDTLGSVVDNDIAGEIRRQKGKYKEYIDGFLSKSVKKEVLDKIPYCIAGEDKEKMSTIKDDWLKTLWETCVDCSSEETRPFLMFYANHRLFKEVGIVLVSTSIGVGVGAGAGAAAGAKVGAAVGTVVSPGTGTVVGSIVGGVVGGGSVVGIIASKNITNN